MELGRNRHMIWAKKESFRVTEQSRIWRGLMCSCNEVNRWEACNSAGLYILSDIIGES